MLAGRSECCGVRGRGAQLRERRVRVPASLSSLPPARSLSAVQFPPPTPHPTRPTGLRCPRAPSSPLLGVSLSRAVPQATSPSARGPAPAPEVSPRPGSPAQPSSPAPEPEVRAGDSATEGACAKPAAATPTPAEPGLERAPPAPYFRDAAHRPLSASRPLPPQQLSRRVGSGGAVDPGGLRARRERSLGFRGCLEERRRKERRRKGLEFRRGHDPRTAPGAERVPRFHLHLEQAQRPAGTARLGAREPARRMGGWT